MSLLFAKVGEPIGFGIPNRNQPTGPKYRSKVSWDQSERDRRAATWCKRHGVPIDQLTFMIPRDLHEFEGMISNLILQSAPK